MVSVRDTKPCSMCKKGFLVADRCHDDKIVFFCNKCSYAERPKPIDLKKKE